MECTLRKKQYARKSGNRIDIKQNRQCKDVKNPDETSEIEITS